MGRVRGKEGWGWGAWGVLAFASDAGFRTVRAIGTHANSTPYTGIAATTLEESDEEDDE